MVGGGVGLGVDVCGDCWVGDVFDDCCVWYVEL